MDAIGRLRYLESQVLELLCELGYDDGSREWQETVAFFAGLVSLLSRKERPEAAITEIIRTIREQRQGESGEGG